MLQAVVVDEDAANRRLLRGVLMTVLVFSVLSFIGLVAGQAPSMSRAVFFPVFLAVVGTSYWQLARSVQRSAAILVVGLWLATSAVTVLFAGVHSANLLIYAFLILLTGWIKGKRWLMGMTGLTIALVLGLGLLEGVGLYHPSPRASVVFVTLTLVGTLFAIGVLISAAYGSLTQARDRGLALAKEMAQQNQVLAQRERDLQMILEHVPAGVASFDALSNLRYGNLHYASLFGATPDELLGRNIADYVSKESLADVFQPWQKCLAGEAASYRRVNRNHRTGEARIFDVKLEPEYEHGQVTGMFALMIDVTDKVAAEDQIRELNETLEKRVAQRTRELEAATDRLQRAQEELARSETKAALSTMIASVSHELSTPLGNSLMTAGTLLDQGNAFQRTLEANQIKRSDLQGFVDTVRQGNDLLLRNLHRATALLGNFRQVASDHASEERRVFDLSATVGEVVHTLAPSLKRHPHTMRLTIPDGIQMDSLPGALGQVVINLINNAYLHAFEGRNDGLLVISAAPTDGGVVLEFMDNGVGMSPEHLDRLFEPFFSTKKGRGGTGLGMGIVENLVRKTLGGTLNVESELGVGTCFTLYLPLVAPPSESHMPSMGGAFNDPA
jgi:PAS domain S-box-containing protein